MKAQEVSKMSDEELLVESKNLRKKLFDLRSKAVTEKLEKPSDMGKVRKDIARVLTVQTSRARKAKA